MMNNKLRKIATVFCMASTVTIISGCQSSELFSNNSTKEQTSENGAQKKETYAKKKEQGYDVTYSGTITGYSEDITIYSQKGEVLKKGKGTFEWVSDSMVKVIFDGKDKDIQDTYIVSQDKVVIHLNQKIETDKIEEDKSNEE